jgi:hypothetical protein
MPAEIPKIRVERWSKTISHDDRCGVVEVMDEKNKIITTDCGIYNKTRQAVLR